MKHIATKNTLVIVSLALSPLLGITNPMPELDEKDYTPALVAEAKRKAEEGDIEQQAIYGRALSNGWSVEENAAEAIVWLKKAAESGNPTAQCSLGGCYADGHGVEKSQETAVIWFEKAASQGLPRAQVYLGQSYFDGEGIGEDKGKAVEWWSKAAEQGDAEAQLLLGSRFYDGNGIEKDAKKAIFWWTKAAEQGSDMAIRILEMVAEDDTFDETQQIAVNACLGMIKPIPLYRALSSGATLESAEQYLKDNGITITAGEEDGKLFRTRGFPNYVFPKKSETALGQKVCNPKNIWFQDGGRIVSLTFGNLSSTNSEQKLLIGCEIIFSAPDSTRDGLLTKYQRAFPEAKVVHDEKTVSRSFSSGHMVYGNGMFQLDQRQVSDTIQSSLVSVEIFGVEGVTISVKYDDGTTYGLDKDGHQNPYVRTDSKLFDEWKGPNERSKIGSISVIVLNRHLFEASRMKKKIVAAEEKEKAEESAAAMKRAAEETRRDKLNEF